MKIINFIKTLLILSVLLLFHDIACSQVVVERSKDKVIISGIQYYIHQVKKGETAYSISKAYGITVEELAKENPAVVSGTKEGQALRISVAKVMEVKPAEPSPVTKQHDESKYIYHTMAQGETIYSLSKSYGVSENEIIRSNTGIDINKLSIGTEIAIPRREFTSSKQKSEDQNKKISNREDQNKKISYHKVLQGESFSSIAEKYGLSVRELKKENKNLRFPQVGDFIRIPVKDIEVQQAEVINPDTVATISEKPLIEQERPVGFSEVRDLTGSLNVAVLLPFYLEENSSRSEIETSNSAQGKSVQNEILRGDDWIYPRSLDFVEMYEGILIAADTLRSLGLDINIYPYDIKSDTVEITRLVKSGKLAKMDLIIGPVYSRNLTIVASYARNLNIPVVSPVPLINNSALSGNPTLFMSISSPEVTQEALAKKVSKNYNNNFVFIHSDTTGTDPYIQRFKKQIINELSYKIQNDEIRVKELIFNSRSMFDSGSINRLSNSLSENSGNVVIVASEDAPVISQTIMEVHNLSRKFDVKVFGYPEMIDVENLDPKYFFDLNVMVYSPYWIDYNKENVKRFNSTFRQKFLTEPPEKSYAWQGYDIAYYFVSGIAIHGKNFVEHPEIHYPDLLESQFDFKRKNSGDGFENQKLFLVRYTKDYEIKLIEENNLLPQN
ncbi:MAG: LysM peptidoglycan-binding domain-containing protein [Bacteroidales bacterium]|nr:LysM peptidoglycan-binding domain-containing protein [Bacteroidales bacterium]